MDLVGQQQRCEQQHPALALAAGAAHCPQLVVDHPSERGHVLLLAVGRGDAELAAADLERDVAHWFAPARISSSCFNELATVLLSRSCRCRSASNSSGTTAGLPGKLRAAASARAIAVSRRASAWS